jgi:hypothetical protein
MVTRRRQRARTVECEVDECQSDRKLVNRQQERYATALFLQNSGRIPLLLVKHFQISTKRQPFLVEMQERWELGRRGVVSTEKFLASSGSISVSCRNVHRMNVIQ